VSVQTSPRHAEHPATVLLDGHRATVAEIVDVWLVEDEWWRTPIARYYVLALLTDGRTLSLFHDRAGGGWYSQRYPGPSPKS
jgi:hypothetical protein